MQRIMLNQLYIDYNKPFTPPADKQEIIKKCNKHVYLMNFKYSESTPLMHMS